MLFEVFMTDILLIYPPVSYLANKDDIKQAKGDASLDHPPMGILYLAACLEKEDFSVKIIDTSFKLTKEETVKIVMKEHPKFIGISTLTSNIRGAVQLVRALRQSGYHGSIGLGGHHITTSDPDFIRRYPIFDFGIVGEAEITLPKLVKKIIRDGQEVKGVFQAETPMDLDALPLPARHLVDFKRYENFMLNSISASRGCPYKCLFCSLSAVSKIIRFRNPAAVANEMKEVYRITGSRHFMFMDDCFTMNRKYTITLCNEILKQKTKFCWHVQTRVNLVDDELLKLMRKAGCTKILFGVESGNDRVRNKIVNKKISKEQIIKAFKLTRKNRIEGDMYLMLGFPTETKAELEETINFPKIVRANLVGAHITIPMPGTKLWDDLVAQGKIKKQLIDDYIEGKLGETFRADWPRYIPEGMSLEYLQEARNRIHRNFYLRPSYIIHRLRQDMRSWSKLKLDFIEGLSILRHGRSYRGE